MFSLQPGWCSSFCGWVTFKELLRISYLFKLKHCYATILTPLVHHLFLWWTGNHESWNGWGPSEFSGCCGRNWSLAPAPPPDITAGVGEFPSTSLYGSSNETLYTDLHIGPTRDISTLMCTCIAKYGFSVYCIFYSVMYFLQCLHQTVATLAWCGTAPALASAFTPQDYSNLILSMGPWNVCWTPPQTFLQPESLSGKFCFHSVTDSAVGESFVVTPLF